MIEYTSFMSKGTSYSTWVEIDLEAIRNNIQWFLDNTGVQVMAVVKANAYGHGIIPVTNAALQAGASWCGVARIEEALELRAAGLECPILIMGYTPVGRMKEAVAQQISMAVWDTNQLDLATAAAQEIGKSARLHLKVDTGMSRLGIQPEEAFTFAQRMVNTSGVTLEGLFTHYARADEADASPTDLQEGIFLKVVEQLNNAGIRPAFVHVGNSAASLKRPSAHFNLLRAGIAIYGLYPSGECPLPVTFCPAMTWKAVLSQVKVLPPGRGVSYGHVYTTRTNERIGTVSVGYADGMRRILGNQVLIRGRRVPVVGRVCMDYIMVQLDEVPEAKVGDEVVLIGSQGEARLSAEDVAASWGTINYEVTCAIGPRVPRVYLYKTY